MPRRWFANEFTSVLLRAGCSNLSEARVGGMDSRHRLDNHKSPHSQSITIEVPLLVKAETIKCRPCQIFLLCSTHGSMRLASMPARLSSA